MKKTYLTLALTTLGFLSFAQDTLRISDVRLGFDTTLSQVYWDSLEVTYDTEFIGDEVDPELIQKATVMNSDTFVEVEDSVLVSTEITPTAEESKYRMKAHVKLTPTYFKDGNNTVVIWPEKTDGSEVVKDKTEFEIFIGDAKSIYFLEQSENLLQVINNELIISNESSQKQFIHVYNLNGQVLNQLTIDQNSTKNIPVESGIYVVAIISGKEKRALKILVE